jgi:hypothetical protein
VSASGLEDELTTDAAVFDRSAPFVENLFTARRRTKQQRRKRK